MTPLIGFVYFALKADQEAIVAILLILETAFLELYSSVLMEVLSSLECDFGTLALV